MGIHDIDYDQFEPAAYFMKNQNAVLYYKKFPLPTFGVRIYILWHSPVKWNQENSKWVIILQ